MISAEEINQGIIEKMRAEAAELFKKHHFELKACSRVEETADFLKNVLSLQYGISPDKIEIYVINEERGEYQAKFDINPKIFSIDINLCGGVAT